MSEAKSDWRRRAVRFMYCVLRLWKPMGVMRVFSSAAGMARMEARVRPPGREALRVRMVAAVTVSFVWEESMRAMRVWKRWSCGFGDQFGQIRWVARQGRDGRREDVGT